jgi:hypothetical protein
MKPILPATTIMFGQIFPIQPLMSEYPLCGKLGGQRF